MQSEDLKKVQFYESFSQFKNQIGNYVSLKDTSLFKLSDENMPKDLMNLFVITKIQTRCSIQWQNGEISHNVPSKDLLPGKIGQCFPFNWFLMNLFIVRNVNSYDFAPGDFIRKKDQEEHDQIGIIQMVNPVENTCIVKWLDPKNHLALSVSASSLARMLMEINHLGDRGVEYL